MLYDSNQCRSVVESLIFDTSVWYRFLFLSCGLSPLRPRKIRERNQKKLKSGSIPASSSMTMAQTLPEWELKRIISSISNTAIETWWWESMLTSLGEQDQVTAQLLEALTISLTSGGNNITLTNKCAWNKILWPLPGKGGCMYFVSWCEAADVRSLRFLHPPLLFCWLNWRFIHRSNY